MKDLTVTLSVDGLFEDKQVSPEGIAALDKSIFKEVGKELKVAADELMSRLMFAFQKYIREQPRNPDYPNGSPELLSRRMTAAYVSKIVKTPNSISMFMFDMTHMDWVTRGEGKKTWSLGWFMRFVDDHEGRAHGSADWGFIRFNFAMELAKECADKFIGSERKKQEWLQEMEFAFRGRHNQGIMVKLNEPLFFEFPKFGFAGDYVGRQGHPGYFDWPALQELQTDVMDPNKAFLTNIAKAFNRAAKATT